MLMRSGGRLYCRTIEDMKQSVGRQGIQALLPSIPCMHAPIDGEKKEEKKNKNRGLGIPERDKRLRVDLLTGLSRGPIVACIFLLLLALLALCAKLADWYKVES
ncbi:hypothetical protein MCOR34_011202 [Pyricularia oryzae]|nr:hypothetical protein MCOR34_011202 [Pyricularia oryzae]